MNLPRYICIEGVIGAGKTSLTRMLCERLDARAIYEKPDENPFLADFYRDPQRYAFQVQLFFLLSRYRQQQESLQPDLFHDIAISDYLFAKDRIFAHLNLEDRELFLYDKIASLLEQDIVKPDLVVYLQSSVERLMANIRKRSRAYEKEMSEEYISSLNESYNRFFFHYQETPLLVVNSVGIDFVNNKADFEELVRQIMRPHSGIEYFSPAR
ncbi:MAG TPA: deoxynucleoside kinase [bacterium]|nr:deoxynucleoside kinase [bacterium]HOC90683.1 deoxynucleoside kinase [bacterium]HOH07532.1 deoxynucleoside kinase [bacterium]HOY44258.1 deoxynucleoside kinase [bacterium]HPG83259.1 deoxynucleoside kinase [bacterium]